MKYITAFVLISMTMVSAHASGGFSGGGRLQTPQQVVDPLYEQGKAVFSGKTRSRSEKVDYCVVAPGGTEAEKLKRKTVKPFKRASARQFALSLHDCDMPETKIAEILSQEDFRAVVYYLNKRYKLRLT